ncbi:hypothetical protein KP509_19G018300 [Ceratopteris richardii]|nr:hypothetical protein KP509_19G018300 [Ceratopteris richardii]
MRPRVFGNHLRRQKSLKLRRTGSVSGMQTPARNVVQKFLDGPADMAAQEDAHKQDCRDLLRILSAKGNRVPGFV